MTYIDKLGRRNPNGPKLTSIEIYEALDAWQRGRPILQLAKEYGVAYATLYYALRRYRKGVRLSA